MFFGGAPTDPGVNPPALVSDGWNWHVTDNGLEFTPLEGVKLRLAGVAQYDVVDFSPDRTDIPDEHGFRRLRLSFGGDIQHDWGFFFERNIGGTSPGWEDAWVRYKGFESMDITFGNQKAPFSLDEVTSSDDTIFIERALPNALSPGYYVGLDARFYGKDWQSSSGIFGDPLDGDARKHAQGQSFDTRSTVALVHEKDEVVHIGGSFEYRDVDPGRYRIHTRPEVGLTDVKLIDTGNILDVQSTRTFGFEGATMFGPFLSQAEYIKSYLGRDLVNVSFAGWYGQASYLLTGEHHSYTARGGHFGSVKPASPWGALEVAARWSVLELSDTDVHGGKESNATFGVNWYVNSFVRVMADYGTIHAEPNKHGDDEDATYFAVRLQVGF